MRISLITLKTEWFDITFINAHAPSKATDEEKEEFYSHVDLVLNSVPKDNVIIVLGGL